VKRKAKKQGLSSQEINSIFKSNPTFYNLSLAIYFNGQVYPISFIIKAIGPQGYNIGPISINKNIQREDIDVISEKLLEKYKQTMAPVVYNIEYKKFTLKDYTLAILDQNQFLTIDEYGRYEEDSIGKDAFVNELGKKYLTNILSNVNYNLNEYCGLIDILPDEFYSIIAKAAVLIENMDKINNRDLFEINHLSALSNENDGDAKMVIHCNVENADKVSLFPGRLLDLDNMLLDIQPPVRNELIDIQRKAVTDILSAKTNINEFMIEIFYQGPDTGIDFTKKQLTLINENNFNFIEYATKRNPEHVFTPSEIFILKHWKSFIDKIVYHGIVKRCKKCDSLYDRKRYFSFIKGIGGNNSYKPISGHHQESHKLLSNHKWRMKKYCRSNCRMGPQHKKKY